MTYLDFFVKQSLIGFRVAGSDENASFRSTQLARIVSGIDDGFVSVFQKHPARGIHKIRLTRMDSEKRGVEFIEIINFPGTPWNLGMI